MWFGGSILNKVTQTVAMLQMRAVVLLVVCVTLQAHRVIRQASSVATTECFMIKLEDSITKQRLDELLNIIQSKSVDRRITKMTEMPGMQIITVKLTDHALEVVSKTVRNHLSVFLWL